MAMNGSAIKGSAASVAPLAQPRSSVVPMITSRRTIALLPLLAPFISPNTASAANPNLQRNSAVDDATSPFIQDLLRKTEEQKEDRKKQRLDDYYRRNFGDYFSFQSNNMASQGLSSETQEQIRAWLEKNGDGAATAGGGKPAN